MRDKKSVSLPILPDRRTGVPFAEYFSCLRFQFTTNLSPREPKLGNFIEKIKPFLFFSPEPVNKKSGQYQN
jgi:hypothetical protein